MTNPKQALGLALVVFAGSAGGAWAQDASQQQPLFDSRFYVVPMFASALTPSDRPQKNGYGGGLAIGKSLFPHVGLEVVGDYLYYKGNPLPNATVYPAPRARNSESYGGGLGLNIYAARSNQGLFLHGDGEYGGTNKFVYNVGPAVDFRITENGLLLRVAAYYHKEENEDGEPLIKLGVRYPFGAPPSRPEPPPPPAPEPEVTPAAAPEPPPPPPPPPCDAGHLQGCKGGDTVVLHGVTFEFDKAKLTVNAKTILDGVADSLLAAPSINVEVGGHTDGKGSAAYNLKLSDRRAASVKTYLEGRGIAADRMTSKGYGKTMPIADNKTDEGREQNRRVELKITSGSTTVEAAPAAAAPAPAEAPAAAAPVDASTPTPTPADSTPAPVETGGNPPPDRAEPPADAATPPPEGTPTSPTQ